MKHKPKKLTYWFSPKISYKTFKAVCDKFPRGGIVPQHIDRILWGLLHDRRINIGLEDSDDPIVITLKSIPKGAVLIDNPKKK